MSTTRKAKLEILEGRQMLTVLSFAEVQEVSSPGGAIRHSAFIDFTGDGHLDILTSAGVFTYLHRGDGSTQFADPDPLVRDGHLIAVLDLDSDDDNDLVHGGVITTGDAFFRWYRNDSDQGRLRIETDWSNLDGAATVVDAADIDGDGDLDLAGGFAYVHHSTYEKTASVHWYENTDGEGSFELRVIDAEPDGFLGDLVKLVDLNSDGALDLVTNHAWYENNGNGTSFDLHPIGTAPVFDIADVDGDGDIDLLTEVRQNQVGWRENTDGAATFAAQRTIDGSIRTRPGGISLVDMDRDGDLDVLALDIDRKTLNWYENYSGMGDFGKRQVLMEGLEQASFVDAIDIDRDNDIDILTGAGRGRSPLVLLEGLGSVVPGDSNMDGVFDSSDLVQVFAFGEYEDRMNNNSTFEEGDWNGDGDFNSSDFVFAFRSGNYVHDLAAERVSVDEVFRQFDPGDRQRLLNQRRHRWRLFSQQASLALLDEVLSLDTESSTQAHADSV
ncbi:FG-GAP-like repeat-containing protein [Planctomycetota bacterium]